jgi:hypothetical protein
MRHITNLAVGLLYGLAAFLWAEMLSDLYMIWGWFNS